MVSKLRGGLLKGFVFDGIWITKGPEFKQEIEQRGYYYESVTKYVNLNEFLDNNPILMARRFTTTDI